MVPEHWYVVAESREVRVGSPLPLRRFGLDLVAWWTASGVHIVPDVCPHRGAALSVGRVVDGCLECPFHGFRFDSTGACVEVPAGVKAPAQLRALPREVREAHGWVWVWLGEPREEYPAVPWFDEMPELPSAFFADDWPVHWTRAVENQLDYSHLAFVHRTTIGRFTSPKAKMDVQAGPDRVRAHAPGGPDAQFLEWLAPNIWRNKIGPKMWIQAAFVPIDDTHARTYVRVHQGFVTTPPFGGLLAWAMNSSNKIILGQDRRVVITQRPIVGEAGNGDILLEIDKPIAAFRAWRARGLRNAETPTP